jgi:hypothetical protein
MLYVQRLTPAACAAPIDAYVGLGYGRWEFRRVRKKLVMARYATLSPTK